MNDQYAEIKLELELTKKELLTRLANSTNYEISNELLFNTKDIDKEKIIMNHIREDLRDVERALRKMEYGAYGICEETGEKIPIEKLRILPTAQTIYDFTFSDLYMKNTMPEQHNNHLYLIAQK